jgi:hypothetical protein
VRLFPNERQRFVIARELCLDHVEALAHIEEEGERSQVAARAAEVVAAADPKELPRWFRPWRESFAESMAAHPGTLDEPERMVVAALTQAFYVLSGGGPYPYEPGHFAAAVGIDPPCDPDLEGRSRLIPEEMFTGVDLDLRRVAVFVRDASPTLLAAAAASCFPTFAELRIKLGVQASDAYTKMAAAILGPMLTAATVGQPACAVTGMHPASRAGQQVCVFCGSSPNGQAALTI